MPTMEDSGNANNILPMHGNSNVSCFISLVVAFLVACSEDLFKDLLGSNMSYNFGESDGLGSLCNGSFSEVFLKVPIRHSLPIILDALASSEFMQDVACFVDERLAVSANVHWAVSDNGHNGSSKLNSC